MNTSAFPHLQCASSHESEDRDITGEWVYCDSIKTKLCHNKTKEKILEDLLSLNSKRP